MVLKAVALLLGLVAAACWFWASVVQLEARTGEAGALKVRWWSPWVVLIGIGLTLVVWLRDGSPVVWD